MSLFLFEFKKIWQPKILLALTILALIFSYMFLSFPLRNFPNGHPYTEQYALMEYWTEKYGTTMDVSERFDAEQGRNDLISQIDTFIKTNSQFAEAGIHSYEQWKTVKDEDVSSSLRTLLYSQNGEWLGYRIDAIDSALDAYDVRYSNPHMTETEYTNYEKNRIDNLIDEEKLNGIMPYEAIENVTEYSRWGAVFILLSLLILLAPTITRDSLVNLRQLQWSSRCGRRILRVQLIATLFSTILLVITELALLLAAYSTLNTQSFWKNPINSFFYGENYWIDMTYGQYVLCFIGVISLLAIGAAGITFAISWYSDNYISLLFKAIPFFVVFVLLSNMILTNLLCFNNVLSKLTGIAGTEILISMIIFFISMSLCSIILLREKKRELI